MIDYLYTCNYDILHDLLCLGCACAIAIVILLVNT